MANPDFEAHVDDALAALGRAQEVARQRAIRCGTPFVVCHEGKQADLNPETGKFKYKEAPTAAPAMVREDPEED